MVQQYRVMNEQAQRVQRLEAMRVMQQQAQMQRVQQQRYEQRRALRTAWAEDRRQRQGMPSRKPRTPGAEVESSEVRRRA